MIVGELSRSDIFSYSLNKAIIIKNEYSKLSPEKLADNGIGDCVDYHELGNVCFCNDLVKERYTCNYLVWPMFNN